MGKKKIGDHRHRHRHDGLTNCVTTERIRMLYYYKCWVLIVLNYWGAELGSSPSLCHSTPTRLVRGSYYALHSTEGNQSSETLSDLSRVAQLRKDRAEIWKQMCSNVALATLLHWFLPCWAGLALSNSLNSSANMCPPLIPEHQTRGPPFCSPHALSRASPLNGMFFPEIFLRLLLLATEISAQGYLCRGAFPITWVRPLTPP